MPTFDVSDETYSNLLDLAESFEDTPETVIRRLIARVREPDENAQANKPKAAQRRLGSEGGLLPEGEYWLPILEILSEHGGEARGRDVIARLEPRLQHRLTEQDEDVLDMGEIRWKNRARFARLRMKELGLISDESRRGIWEITERGRDYLEREKGLEESAETRP